MQKLAAIPIWEQERMLDITSFGFGLHLLEDSTAAPLGSALLMRNIMITDRGGISNRQGTALLGSVVNPSSSGTMGLYNYIKSFGSQEIPVRSYGTELEYFHPTLNAWTRLMNGYTANQEFGFKESLVNTENEDYLYFCNRTENYSRWSGATAVTTATLNGGETSILVVTTLKPDVFGAASIATGSDSGTYSSRTLSGSSVVTITDSTKNWTPNQWVGYFLKITSGTQSGEYGIVTANTSTVLTVSLSNDSGATAGYTLSTISPGNQLTFTNQLWASSQWINFYLHFTSGSMNHQVCLITDVELAQGSSTNGFVTIQLQNGQSATMAPGDTYEIRQTIFPLSGTLMLSGTQVAYTAITDAAFTVGSAPATPTNSPVTVVPTVYPGSPRGNRMDTHYTRMVVGNVRSGISYDANGNIQGSQSSGSYYVSYTDDPTNFGFTASRTAGQGDIESTPYGGGDITDIVDQEDSFYVFKPRYIEAVKYTQDANDLAQRTQLKTGFGSINKVIKGQDDVYFITADNQFTSLGRVKYKDTIPQKENIGLNIKRLLDSLDFTQTAGIEFKNRLYIACKAASTDAVNDRILVYNERTGSFEGLWELSAYGFMIYQNNLYYADSRTPNVYQMLTGANDTIGVNQFPITSVWQSNWMNLTPKRRFVPKSNFNLQAASALGVEGYIRGGTKLTFQLFKDFSSTPALTFTFGGTEAQFLDGQNLFVFEGDRPLGAEPIAAFTDPNVDPNIHFQFIVYFPPMYSNFMSIAITNSGSDQYWEVTRLGLRVSQATIYSSSRIKSLTST